METRAHHVLIGLFTVLTIAAALLFTLWLGKSSLDQEFSLYEVVFNESVTGLSIGSPVQYSGIKVGEVNQLRLDPQDPRKVRARIRVDGRTPLKQNTHARLAITGVTGNAVIQLYGGTPSSPLLTTDNAHPTELKADPSPLAKLLANGEDMVGNINQILIRANQLFSEQNIQHASNTLAHFDELAQALSNERGTLTQSIHSLNEAAKQANLTLQNSAKLAATSNQLIDEEGRRILQRTEQTIAAFERSSQRIELLLKDNQGALSSSLQGMAEIGPAINELRTTLATLRQSGRKLADNPGALLDREQNQEFQP